jgi:hypothetical protein
MEQLARLPMRDERAMQMVEIIVLKWKCPEIETKCAQHLISHTAWPFKLVMYDNRPNSPNTSRIWNKLIRQATCEFVCVMDSDVFVQPSEPCWLQRMMDTFARFPDCRLVLPVTDRCSTPAQKVTAPDQFPAVVRHDHEWSGFCFLMRKNLIEQVGEFDQEFVGYGQDSEFSMRLAREGGGSYIRRDVMVNHLHGASFRTASLLGAHDDLADREYAQRLFQAKQR